MESLLPTKQPPPGKSADNNFESPSRNYHPRHELSLSLKSSKEGRKKDFCLRFFVVILLFVFLDLKLSRCGSLSWQNSVKSFSSVLKSLYLFITFFFQTRLTLGCRVNTPFTHFLELWSRYLNSPLTSYQFPNCYDDDDDDDVTSLLGLLEDYVRLHVKARILLPGT